MLLKRRDINLCAGDFNLLSRGVFRRFNRAMYISDPSRLQFSRTDFALRTALSASPLDCDYRGLMVLCTMSHSFINDANSRLENWQALSVIKFSGEPKREN